MCQTECLKAFHLDLNVFGININLAVVSKKTRTGNIFARLVYGEAVSVFNIIGNG